MPSSDAAGAFTPLAGVGPVVDAGAFHPFGLPRAGAFAPAVSVLPAAANEPDPGPADELRLAFQAGYEAARRDLQAETETIAESFVKSLEELAAFRGRLRDRYERELLEVALGVARKVVQQELAERPEIWLTMIRAAVRRAVERGRIVLRVPGTLAAFLRERMPELRASLEAVKEIEVVEDPGLPPSGCVIESSFGEVDIGVESQIETARVALQRAEE